MKKLIISLVVGLLICSVYATTSQWNLNADWDTVNNPSGSWTYHQDPGTQFTAFEAWGGPDFPLGENGWRLPGKPGHLGMSKMVHNSSEDLSHTYSYAAGSIIGHTNEAWGAGWIAPEAGTYVISGAAHKIRNGMGSIFVSVVIDGVELFKAKLEDGGLGKNKDNPYIFSQEVTIAAGTLIDLQVNSINFAGQYENGDFGSIADYNIELIPEPATLLLLAGGAISMICRKKRA